MRKAIIALALLLPVVGMAQTKKSGNGTFTYDGPKIELSGNSFSCKHIAKLQGTEGESYQGLDIWGDYILSCQNSGWLTIYQFDGDKVKRVAEPFKLASYGNVNHSNVASLSRTFYDKEDKFPLFYVSQCHRKPVNGRKDVIYVERISNDMKSSELIQTIYFKDSGHLFGYALQWVIDTDNNFLYGYGNTVDNNNPLNRHRIVKFRIPSLSDSTDGLVVLTEDDLIENYLIEDSYAAKFNPVGQGLYIKNGLLFMPVGLGKEKSPSYLYVWNLNERRMQNVIDLREATFGELEDCSTYGDALIIQSQGDLFKLNF